MYYVCLIHFHLLFLDLFNFLFQNVEKIKKVVDEGNYYGAQQMYKSFGARYVCQRMIINV